MIDSNLLTGHYTASNAFRVTSHEAFEQWCANRHLLFRKWQDSVRETYYTIEAAADFPGWPHIDLATGHHIDFASELASYLDPRDFADLAGIYANDRLRIRTLIHADGSVDAFRFRDLPEPCAVRGVDPPERDVAER